MLSTAQKTVHVLNITTEQDDTFRTAQILGRGDSPFTAETVSAVDDGLASLVDRPPDCIISTCPYSDAGGFEFLRQVRERRPDLPFIFVAESSDLDHTAEAIDAGATDCLQKEAVTEHQELLGNRVLSAVEHQQLKHRFQTTHEEYTAVFENAQEGLMLVDVEDGGFCYRRCNQRGVELIGRDRTDVVGESPETVLGPSNARKVIGAYRTCIREQKPVEYVVTLELPVGEVVRECQVAPVSTDGTPDQLVVSFYDVTEHRRNQEELETERQFIQQSLDGLEDVFYILDTAGRLRGWNERVTEVTGFEGSDLDGVDAVEIFPEDERDKIAAAIESTLTTGETTVEADLLTSDGKRIPHEFKGKRVTDDDGNVTDLVGVGRDLTERRQREQRFQALVEESNDIISIVDATGRFQYQSPSLERILGYGVDETLGDTVWGYIHPDDRERVKETFQEWIAAPGAPDPIEYRARHADDSWRWMEARGNNQLDNPAVEGYVLNSRDITDRKNREQEADTITSQYKALVQNFPDGAVFLYDEDGRVVRAGGAELAAVGLSAEEIEGSKPHDRYPQSIADELAAHVEDALSGESHTFEQKFNGEYYQTQTVPVRTDENEISHCLTVLKNVTQQRERERELERKTRAIEEAPVGITITDPSEPDNPMIYVNERFVTLTGYQREEVLDRNCRLLQGEETSTDPVDTMRSAVRNQTGASTELVNYRKDGTKFWSRVDIAPVHDESGELVNYVGFQQDVTERKEREQAIEESRNRYRTLVENYPNGAVALVDQNLTYTTVGGTTVEGAGVSPSEITGQNIEEVLPAEITEVILPHYKAALDGEARNFEESIGDREYQFRIVPVRDDDGDVFAAMGVSQNITERKRRLRALEKRERILRELHTATREFVPPEAEADIAEFLVEFIEKAFGFEYVSVKQFDEESGCLQPAAWVTENDDSSNIGVITPSDTPIWEVYRQGESKILEATGAVEAGDVPVDTANQLLVAPIGDFGVTIAYTTGESVFDSVDMELIEVVAANAESSFQRLRSDKVRTELVDQLSTHQRKVDELRRVIDAIQAIQQRLGDSDSQEALETGVCEELLETDAVDFVWLGRPQGRDTSLRPTAWAGDGAGYLDSVATDDAGAGLPAHQAVSARDLYCQGNIASLVVDESWAKDALSANFRSVVSVPLVYDDVVYGVLTAYSQEDDVFDQIYQYLITDVASLLVNYSRILEQRYDGSRGTYTELEFSLADPQYPLQRLATETACQIRLETILENMTDEMRALVTVEDGETGVVLEAAVDLNSITAASRFGSSESDQLTLTMQKPFLASVIAKHGGTLVESASDESGTRLSIELQNTASKRPLLDSLNTQYQEIKPVAQRQINNQPVSGPRQVANILTDRQYEILNAAYHGGYYETPRAITGAELAESFDISSPAIYNHLQSAHRTLLEAIVFPDGHSQ